MIESGCPCKGWKNGVIHAAALFLIIFLAVSAANCVARICPWYQGKAPPAAALVK